MAFNLIFFLIDIFYGESTCGTSPQASLRTVQEPLNSYRSQLSKRSY
ncbi:hypothetical protein NEOC65_001689, partial [Neochlamydia sp. AcF65]|nr:hypothetical protein [Neochlamydia sp. AcF65]